MEDATPTRKVGAGALAGALSVILVWVMSEATFGPGWEIPAAVASALTVVITFCVSWFVPER